MNTQKNQQNYQNEDMFNDYILDNKDMGRIDSSVNKTVQKSTQEKPEINVYISEKKNIKPLNNFVILFYESLEVIINKYKLNGKDITVLIKFLKYMENGNLITVNKKSMAEDLGMATSNLSRSIKKLKQSGLIVEDNGNEYINLQVITKQSLKNSKEKNPGTYHVSTKILGYKNY